MVYSLSLAGIHIKIVSEVALNVDQQLQAFLDPRGPEPDCRVDVSWDWNAVELPGPCDYMGEDLLCRYYRVGDQWYCLTKGRPGIPVSCAVYSADCRAISCTINAVPFLAPPDNLGSMLRMLPMRRILLEHRAAFLHASRISVREKAILFAAPSGTGKTTQAGLWHDCRGAEILGNDRTLLRKIDGTWQSFGYPLDGSDPVLRNAVAPLGAVVLLEQGPVNRVCQMSPRAALPRLMRQSVLDSWNPSDQTSVLELLADLMEDIPVLELTCTPDERAVAALEAALTENEVL